MDGDGKAFVAGGDGGKGEGGASYEEVVDYSHLLDGDNASRGGVDSFRSTDPLEPVYGSRNPNNYAALFGEQGVNILT